MVRREALERDLARLREGPPFALVAALQCGGDPRQTHELLVSFFGHDLADRAVVLERAVRITVLRRRILDAFGPPRSVRACDTLRAIEQRTRAIGHVALLDLQ